MYFQIFNRGCFLFRSQQRVLSVQNFLAGCSGKLKDLEENGKRGRGALKGGLVVYLAMSTRVPLYNGFPKNIALHLAFVISGSFHLYAFSFEIFF